ncbi:MAG: UDP-N-acetylmuramoyl-tripeptide--D-alanyl-D-alanine ligase [Candidatus Nanopelagicales bacterium]
MAELTLAEIIAITNGVPNQLSDLEIKPVGISYDSRDTKQGDLFAAFVGQNSDGHDFVNAAIASGAVAALVSKPIASPSILVDDVLLAITKLAAANRAKLDVPVLALTGSAGKTTTKDLLIDLLQPLGKVIATTGSRNNELGLPVTLFAADKHTAAVVLEMGARHRGNIRELCEIAKPTIVGITNIGSAHLGEFGSREMIMHTKGEIVELLPPSGIAVLNADQPESMQIARKTKARVQYAGFADSADLRIENLKLDSTARCSFDLVTPLGEVRIKLKLVGEHQAHNAAIAAGMALAAGLSLEAAVARSQMRLSVEKISNFIVIDDSYNANPESVTAALTTLNQMECSGKRIAVLGEMAELGEQSIELHQEIGSSAANLDLLIGVGDFGKLIISGAIQGGMAPEVVCLVETKELAISKLKQELQSGDVVLIKASRSAGFDEIAGGLRNWAKG